MRSRRFIKHGISVKTTNDCALVTRMERQFGKDAVALTVMELTNRSPRLRAPRPGKVWRALNSHQENDQ